MRALLAPLVLFGTVYLTDLFSGYITRDQSSYQEGNKKHPENSKGCHKFHVNYKEQKLFYSEPSDFSGKSKKMS